MIPVKFKKDGGYTASSSVAEETQLQRLSRHVSRKLSEYGELDSGMERSVCLLMN